MRSANYVPVLKCKSSDVRAVLQLYPSDVQNIKPLFELPLRPARTSVESHLASSLGALAKNPPGMPYFFDPYGFMADDEIAGQSAELCALSGALALGATPVYGLDKETNIWAKLSSLIKNRGSGLAFRIPTDMLEFSPESVWEEVMFRAQTLGLSLSEVDLLIDGRSLSETNIDVLREAIIDFLALAPKIQLRSVVVLGSSALSSVASVPKESELGVFRREYALWGGLQFEMSDAVDVGYGDYGVVHPDLLIAGPNKNANGKIRYTSGMHIHYFRGHSLFDPAGSGFGQYRDIARRVIKSGLYQDAGFSKGDQYIADCANLNVGPGNLGTWVTNDMNHHISYASRQVRLVRRQLIVATNRAQVSQILAES